MTSKFAILLAMLTVSTTLSFLVAPANTATAVAAAPPATNDVKASSPSTGSFVSPITGLHYTIKTEPLTGALTYSLDGVDHPSTFSILEREAALFPDGAYKIEPALRTDDASGEPDGRLPVLIYLASQFGSDVSSRVKDSYFARLDSTWTKRQALLDKIMSMNLLGPIPSDLGSIDSATAANFRSADEDYVTAFTTMRRDIYTETEKLNAPVQDPIVAKIENLGGVVWYRGPLVNVITARVSPTALRELVKDPEVGSVFRDGIVKAQLDVSVPSIGAPDWWAAGYNTPTYKLTVADTGIDKSHPALTGHISDEGVFHDEGKLAGNYNDDPANPDDLQGHGTHVAGIVVSQDATYKGTAYGLKGVINAKFGWLNTGGGGEGRWGDAMKAIDWAINTAGTSVVSFSFGESTNGNGNGGYTRFVDAVVDDLGIAYATAAGNDGPGANTVGIPGDSYNAIVVGAMNDVGTTNRADDSIASFSSRGPTADGRMKPDIVAPGEDSSNPGFGIYSCNYKWETQGDFIDYPGTSMATPHVGGASILLLNYLGPRGFFPAVPKALLLENAQDRGAVGPDNDYGYGYIDLTTALANKDKVYNHSVPSGAPRFYLGTWAGGDRATMVWQRHVTYRGSSYPTIYYNLNNLDLFLYNGPANTLASSATSTIENVEQIRYSSPVATAVLKVKAIGALNGVTSEPYALATLKAFTYALPPTYQFTWDGASSAEVNTIFSLTVNVTNIGDLTGFGATGTLTIPPGVTMMSGTNPVPLGDIAPGAKTSTTWTFRGDTVGDKTFNFAVTSNAYGENFNANDNHMVRVMDNIPPVVNGVWAAPSPQNAGLKVNVTANITDNLAVTSAFADVVGPMGPVGNFSMAKHSVSGLWFVDRAYFVAGNYDATVWGTDTDHWDSGMASFSIVDSTPPVVVSHNAAPNPQQIHGNVNITAQITDQAGVVGAWVQVTDPFSAKVNYTMLGGPTSFSFEHRYDVLGIYGYDIWAVDPSGNWKTASGTFQVVDTVPPAVTAVNAQPNPQVVFSAVNVTATITDVGGVTAAYAEITDPVGGKVNVTMQSAGSSYWYRQPYSTIGNYSYRISGVDIVNQWGIGTGTFRIIDPIAPIARAGADDTIAVNSVYSFDGSTSTDNYGITSYRWTFTDQVPVVLNGATPTYRFDRLGMFTVTLTVRDESGNSGADTMNVTVRDYEKPVITGPSALPSPQNPGGSVQIRANITDNVLLASVWVNVWDPLMVLSNYSMSSLGGDDFGLTRTYSIIGNYAYKIWAGDSSGNWNSTMGGFVIKDMIRPRILSISDQPDPQEILNSVVITARLQDSVGVTGVWVEVTRPDSTLAGNFSMSYDSGVGAYTRTYPTNMLGVHNYTVTATDAAGNWNSSSGQFLVRDTIRPTVFPTNMNLNNEVDTTFNFTATANDNYLVDKVSAEVTDPTSTVIGNFTMDFAASVASNRYVMLTFTQLGSYQIRLWVSDFGGNWGTNIAGVTSIDTHPPTADAGPDQTVNASTLVTFDGSGSSDSHGISSYSWGFLENSAQITLQGPSPSHTFIKAGIYSVTLTVTDFGGNNAEDRMIVTVRSTNGGGGNGGGNGDGTQRGLLQIFVDDFLVGMYGFVLIIVLVVGVVLAVAISKRRSKKQEEEKRRLRAKQRLAQQRAQQESLLPPPPEDGAIQPEETTAPKDGAPPPPPDSESPPPPSDP